MATDINVLLVEGNDDLHVFCNLFAHYHLPDAFRVKAKDGVDQLLNADQLWVELHASERERVGIVLDADTDLGKRWQALRKTLGELGYAVPVTPPAAGTVIEHHDLPTVGIWIMPDNALPGMLEDFVSRLVPPEDPLWPRAVHCVDALPAVERRFAATHHSKACIHTWLAWQQDPGVPMGLAIARHYLDPGSPHAQPFLQWIQRLFAIS